MDEGGGNKGLWAGLVVAALAAVTFLILWIMNSGDVDRLRSEMRAAESAASSSAKRLEDDLRSAKNEVESGERKARELEERLRAEMRRASDLAAQTERRLRSDLGAAEDRAAESKAELERVRAEMESRSTAEVAAVRAELTKVRTEAEERAKAAATERSRLTADLAASRSDADEARRDLEAAEKSLASLGTEAKSMRAELQSLATVTDEAVGLRERLSAATEETEKAKKTIADLEANAKRLTERLERERKEAAGREKNLKEELEKLKAKVDEQSTGGDAAAENVSLKAEIDNLRTAVKDRSDAAEKALAQAEALRGEVEALKNEMADVSARASASAASDLAALRAEAERLRAELKEKTTLLAKCSAKSGELGKELEQARERVKIDGDELVRVRTLLETSRGLLDSSTRERDALQKRVETLEAGAGDNERLLRRIRELEEAPSPSEEKKDDTLDTASVPGVRRTEPQSGIPALQTGERSMGRIVEKLQDDKTLLVNVGDNQRARSGMKFDVYRQEGEGRRFIGNILLTRALPDFSLAVTTNPATSIPAGCAPDLPAIGDYIDNPYYNPQKQLIFAVSPELAADACAFSTVEAMGGIAQSGLDVDGADYLLVRDAVSGVGDVDLRLPRVSMFELANYLDPKPAGY